MDGNDEYNNHKTQMYDYYDEFNNIGAEEAYKKDYGSVAENIKYNKRVENIKDKYDRKKIEDMNFEKNKSKLENFHIVLFLYSIQ